MTTAATSTARTSGSAPGCTGLLNASPVMSLSSGGTQIRVRVGGRARDLDGLGVAHRLAR